MSEGKSIEKRLVNEFLAVNVMQWRPIELGCIRFVMVTEDEYIHDVQSPSYIPNLQEWNPIEYIEHAWWCLYACANNQIAEVNFTMTPIKKPGDFAYEVCLEIVGAVKNAMES